MFSKNVRGKIIDGCETYNINSNLKCKISDKTFIFDEKDSQLFQMIFGYN